METAQASSQGDALKKLTEALNEAEQKFADVKKTFGVKHPEYPKAQARVEEIQSQIAATRAGIVQRVEAEYRQAANRETMLEQAVKETKADFDSLNARSFEYQSLKREAESDKKLYEELVRKIKEEGINASFQNSSIRIADEARPGLKPVFPRTWLNVLLAFLLASFIGVGAAVLGDVLDNTVRDPDQVARLMNTDVIGSLPAVKDWRRRAQPHPESRSLPKYHRPAERKWERPSESREGIRGGRPGALQLRRSHPHPAQFHPVDRLRPPLEECAADQRLAFRRQIHRGGAPCRHTRQPAQAHAPD